MAGRVCARSAGDEVDEHEEEVGEVHRCKCRSNIGASLLPHTRVPIPLPETTRYGSATPNEETTIEMPRADSALPARRLRQVGWSARRLRQVGWSARRLRQEPFDEPSARVKFHWRARIELSELSAESRRQGGEDAKTWNHAAGCQHHQGHATL